MSATHPIILFSSSPRQKTDSSSQQPSQDPVAWLALSSSPPASPAAKPESPPPPSPLAKRVNVDCHLLSNLLPSTPPGSPRSSSPDRASPIAAVLRLPRFSEEDIDAAPVRTSNEDGEDKDDSDDDPFCHDEAEEDYARPSDDDSSDLSSVPGDECSDVEMSEDGSLRDSDHSFEIGDSEEISEGSSEDEDEEASSSDGSSGSSIDGDEEQRRANKDPRGTWRPPRQKRKRTASYDSDSDSDDDKPISALIKDKPLPLELKVPIAPLLQDKPLPLKNPSLKRKLARLAKGKTY
ncbi:unnamed protein product [Tilletia laevis]|uniref:Uncharacterized protein n=3 Tax=Tilletia TaxID=13289 RepID=A0A8X7MXQ8_9BASI|nr:hypothetical protein CF335_g8998 [Tilletia laevis]KAE8192562.1 hypothetical protein CF328_g5323 [Tilletia controversa]CAD6888316.1 unnamed protein product [Tilletia caries]KAE8197155.1 hypothetical protein CF336_g2289 [Tilletia laevis]KAE8252967.1 hypothetical protein A4X06_0g1795 [Tilletia controversa]